MEDIQQESPTFHVTTLKGIHISSFVAAFQWRTLASSWALPWNIYSENLVRVQGFSSQLHVTSILRLYESNLRYPLIEIQRAE